MIYIKLTNWIVDAAAAVVEVNYVIKGSCRVALCKSRESSTAVPRAMYTVRSSVRISWGKSKASEHKSIKIGTMLMHFE